MKLKNINKPAAFTLAEVLITLGIIGIVAALTIPQLIKNYQVHVLQNQFKTAFADLNNASRLFMLHNDMSVSEYAYFNGSKEALKLFQKEFTTTLKKTSHTTETIDEDGNRIEPYLMKNLVGNNRALVCDHSGYFWDPQGRIISFDDAPQTLVNGPKVCIDINGIKNPNTIGKDYFVFMFTVDGQVIPFGHQHKNNPPTVEDGNSMWTNSSVANPKDYCKYTNYAMYEMTCSYFAISNTHPRGASGKDYWHDFISGH